MDDTKDTKDIKETGEAASVLSADEQMIRAASSGVMIPSGLLTWFNRLERRTFGMVSIE